jgi:arginyl-tRNA synthetase
VLDFDLAKVIEQSKDNPVFYVQYGHARGYSVFRNAAGALPDLPSEDGARARWLADAALDRLDDSAELAIMRKIALYPRLLEAAALAHEPHRIAFYLGDLAASFHALWNQGKERPELRFLQPDQSALTRARLAMIGAVQVVLANGLELIGVRPVEEML